MEKIRPNLSIIVAIASNRAIGKENRLLWHLPEDLRRFKRLTSGHAVLMGRNTFLSLPKGALPNRKNIVVTDRPGEQFEGCTMAYSLEEALEMTEHEPEVFVMGGGILYRQLLPVAGKLYLTRVEETFDADIFFPEIDFSQWEELELERVEASEKNPFPHTFTVYKRRGV